VVREFPAQETDYVSDGCERSEAAVIVGSTRASRTVTAAREREQHPHQSLFDPGIDRSFPQCHRSGRVRSRNGDDRWRSRWITGRFRIDQLHYYPLVRGRLRRDPSEYRPASGDGLDLLSWTKAVFRCTSERDHYHQEQQGEQRYISYGHVPNLLGLV